MPGLTPETAQDFLISNFAPWVQDLDLRVEAFEDGVTRVRMPLNKRLYREGGTLCGQSLMAFADTVAVLTLVDAMNGFRPMTTVSQTTNFLKPISNADAIAEGRVLRLGRSMAFAEVAIRADGANAPAGHVTSAFALLAPKQ
jgi:uncharacterized protein (TIGR00369 family)